MTGSISSYGTNTVTGIKTIDYHNIILRMEDQKFVIGHCPVCNASVVKTCRGYRCENALNQQATCSFSIPAIICNRYIADKEAGALLADGQVFLDGFFTNEGKHFSSVLSLDEQFTPRLNAKINICPACGGDLYVNTRGVSCSNFRQKENPCKFTIWRFYGGHEISLNEIKQILENGITSEAVTMFREDGVIYTKRLGLAPDKLSVIKF